MKFTEHNFRIFSGLHNKLIKLNLLCMMLSLHGDYKFCRLYAFYPLTSLFGHYYLAIYLWPCKIVPWKMNQWFLLPYPPIYTVLFTLSKFSLENNIYRHLDNVVTCKGHSQSLLLSNSNVQYYCFLIVITISHTL